MTQTEIKNLRKKLRMTQQEFAWKLGVGIATISHWETGKFKPTPLAMEKLLRLEKRNK